MFAYDWLVVCLSMLQGDHLEVNEIQLLRSGHAPGKYFEKYDRHFVREKGLTGTLSSVLPLMPLTKALKQNLPASAWRKAFWRVVRLNAHQTLLFLKWKFPVLEGTFAAVKRVDRALVKS